MAEQPEQVLPQERIAAARRVEEGQVEGALEFEQDRAEDQRRKADQHHHGGDQQVPGEDRHPVERHARRAHLQDRDGDLDRRGDGGNLDEGDAEQPDIGIDAGRIGATTRAACT